MLIFLIHLTQEFLQQYWLFHLFFNFFSSSDIWFICFIIFSVHTDCFHFYIIFQTATQFFFKLCIALQCHETWLLCIFLDEILFYFIHKRSLSNYKFGEIKTLKFGTLMGSFFQNNIKFQIKKHRRAISHDTEEWYKVEEKLTCSFKYDMRGFLNFYPTTQRSKNFTSMGYFCPK